VHTQLHPQHGYPHRRDPGSAFAPSDWHEFSFSEDVFGPPNIVPRHVREAPQPSGVKRGLWALDVDIERTVDYSRFDNVQHHWRLPRRLRMTGAFARGYTLGNNGPFCMPRVSARGFVTLFSDADGGLPEVRVPVDKTAFSHALCSSAPLASSVPRLQTCALCQPAMPATFSRLPPLKAAASVSSSRKNSVGRSYGDSASPRPRRLPARETPRSVCRRARGRRGRKCPHW
jgi:hypothetical protein